MVLPVASRGGVMRFEAVVAEAQREQICRTAEGGVGAASVGGGDQDAAFGGRCFRISSSSHA